MKKDDFFSKEELERYSRHLIIPEFNIDGQKKLKSAKVLVVGTGGLGAPLLQYLTAAGVGTIGVVDFDVVEDSNLQRQVLFSTDDVGKPKTEAAVERMKGLNPHIEFKIYNTQLNSSNALDIIKEYDIVADGTDNFPTRYLVNDACVLLNKPYVYASIFRFDGQLTVFNYQYEDGTTGPNYRDLYSEPPPPGLVPSCAEGGVIGVLPGILGSLQANEVIKVLSGVGDPLIGRMFSFDTLGFETRIFKFKKDPKNPISGENPTIHELIDYEHFCGIPQQEEEDAKQESVKELSAKELKELKENGEDFQLIDVREEFEYRISNLGGELIPLNNVLDEAGKIAKDKKVVVHCRTGARSGDAIRALKEKFGYDNLYNLKGGILEYADEIDDSLAKY
ncbi:molybdopterin-synthase adenylyltransferase MoeB [Salibacter sp.]|uniref:molybdopterin-synthase adenylyltransferase MoeB n=1 Tax=Salibacter sp. TaxID=2010995 RepID=UPI0028701AB5|nr:molybdopterin-synthase adenylyltransferase MoeB [Salibacter sp.]MDR9397445.1 molybdopterin-synthase adenylyltransferase MoeB [Salibacter sp.]MDR9486679.1 molybdopterin-synthase adenylyltransferase MoeB [Salibacter sp.]